MNRSIEAVADAADRLQIGCTIFHGLYFFANPPYACVYATGTNELQFAPYRIKKERHV